MTKPFLNQQKEVNDHRNYFMINLNKLVTPGSAVRMVTDCVLQGPYKISQAEVPNTAWQGRQIYFKLKLVCIGVTKTALILIIILPTKCCLLMKFAALQTNFINEANTLNPDLNPDLTAPT